VWAFLILRILFAFILTYFFGFVKVRREIEQKVQKIEYEVFKLDYSLDGKFREA
jgi:hypothetical protein